MALTIGANIASLLAQRQLAKGTDLLSRTLERLASGSRLNHASDDPAALAIASQLNSNAKLYTQAIRNVNDGLSVVSIADSALAAMSSVITRVAELSEQAANGVYSSKQRLAMDTEAQALISEYQRVVSTTTFNGVSLLSGEANLDLQVGIGGDRNSRIQLSLDAPTFDSESIGLGTFGTAFVRSVTGRIAYIRSGDFNGDGLDDLVTISDSGAATTVFLSNGDGTFRASYTISNSSRLAGIGDFDRDGKTDMAWVVGTGGFDIYKGDGSGGFSATFHGSAPVAASELSTGDINGDGVLDLVAVNYSANNNMYVYLGNGDGTFGAARTTSGLVNARNTTEFRDFNGDGKSDMVVRGLSTVYMLYGNGDGYFSFGQTFTPGTATWGTLADVNNDGYQDYLTELGGGTAVGIFLANSNGTFRASTSLFMNEYLGRAGDINGDGIADITTLLTADNSAFKAYLGNGDGTFRLASTANMGLQTFYDVLADFNGDGVLDYAASGYTGSNFSVILQDSQETGSSFSDIDLTTQATARDTLTLMRSMLDSISAERGKLGAYESRLNSALGTLQVGREGTLAAESRIRDADIAAESATLIRQQILQQAAASVLAQANSQPQLVLNLLRNS